MLTIFLLPGFHCFSSEVENLNKKIVKFETKLDYVQRGVLCSLKTSERPNKKCCNAIARLVL